MEGRGTGTKDLPQRALRAALVAAGVDEEKHSRGSLRSIIHCSTGEPPPEHLTADDLASLAIALAKKRLLRFPN